MSLKIGTNNYGFQKPLEGFIYPENSPPTNNPTAVEPLALFNRKQPTEDVVLSLGRKRVGTFLVKLLYGDSIEFDFDHDLVRVRIGDLQTPLVFEEVGVEELRQQFIETWKSLD